MRSRYTRTRTGPFLQKKRGPYGKWVLLEEELEDAITGLTFPKSQMVKQCGRWVARDPRWGSYDAFDPGDDPCAPGPAGTTPADPPPAYASLSQPLCLYHFDSTGKGFLGDSGSLSYHLSLEALGEG